MGYGVLYAQRGWVTSDRVINTRPVGDLRRWIAARR
jgi:hypothetical protein